MSFYNRKTTSHHTHVFQETDCHTTYDFQMADDTQHHRLSITRYSAAPPSTITLTAKDILCLLKKVALLRALFFGFEERTTDITDSIAVSRTTDIMGRWSTTIMQRMSGILTHDDVHLKLYSIEMTVDCFDDLWILLIDVQPMLEETYVFPPAHDVLRMVLRTSLTDPEALPQYFITSEEASRGLAQTAYIWRGEYERYLHALRVFRRIQARVDPQVGTQASPIVVDDDDRPSLLTFVRSDGSTLATYGFQEGQEPEYLLELVTIKRPRQDTICRYLAMKFFMVKIVKYQNMGLPPVTTALEDMSGRWAPFQRHCADLLQELQYVKDTPTQEYIKTLTNGRDRLSPVKMAIEAMTVPTAYNEKTALTLAYLNALFRKYQLVFNI